MFDFVGPVPPWQAVRYVDRLIADPSGVSVRIAGRAILGVSFRLVQLTTGGGRLLKTARTVKLTANGTFAPILYAAVSTTRTFTLAR